MSTSPPSVDLHALAGRVRTAMGAVVVGQDDAVDALLVAWLAGGHVLLEGVPGVGKTLLARALAQVLGLDFGRVQFTPDLMPADVTGGSIYDFRTQQFRVERGPVFCQVLLADELNRAPPRTQSALLEAMQERQVTLDGTSHALDRRFFVVATQNPLEQEGTWPLPEAQLDRFLLKVTVAPPDRTRELAVYRRFLDGDLTLAGAPKVLAPIVTAEERAGVDASLAAVHVEDSLLDYLHGLVARTRGDVRLLEGASPRAALALLAASRAWAAIQGRDFVIPDDLKQLAPSALAHRLAPAPEAELDGLDANSILAGILDKLEVPR